MFLIALAVMLGFSAAFRSGHYLSPAIVIPLLATLYAMAYLSMRQRNLRLYLRGRCDWQVLHLESLRVLFDERQWKSFRSRRHPSPQVIACARGAGGSS
jgi:hypothetical protein